MLSSQFPILCWPRSKLFRTAVEVNLTVVQIHTVLIWDCTTLFYRLFNAGLLQLEVFSVLRLQHAVRFDHRCLKVKKISQPYWAKHPQQLIYGKWIFTIWWEINKRGQEWLFMYIFLCRFWLYWAFSSKLVLLCFVCGLKSPTCYVWLYTKVLLVPNHPEKSFSFSSCLSLQLKRQHLYISTHKVHFLY
jgi:hypothetical protein